MEKILNINEKLERLELIDIYNGLSPLLKKQLLNTARIIDNTATIILTDLNKKEVKKM